MKYIKIFITWVISKIARIRRIFSEEHHKSLQDGKMGKLPFLTPAVVICGLIGLLFIFAGVAIGDRLKIDPNFAGTAMTSFFDWPRIMAFWGPTFIKEMGFAFVIATILAWLIERRAHQARLISEENARARQEEYFHERNEEVNRGLFGAVYRRSFEEDYIKLIESILESAFYVKGYELNITLRKNEDKQAPHKAVTVDFSWKFKVFNISKEKQKYPFCAFIERLHNSSKDSHPVEFIQIGKKIYTTKQDFDLLDKAVDNSKNFKRYSDEIPIQKESHLDVYVKAKMEKSMNDEFTWRIFQPSDGFRINVTSDIAELQLGGVGIVGSNDSTPEPELESTGHLSSLLKIEKPLLPGHGGQIWWTDESDIDRIKVIGES